MRSPISMCCAAWLAACGGSNDDEPAVEEQPSAISASCTPPADCLPIVSLINIGVCCSDSLRCGFDMTPFTAAAPMYPELAALAGLDPATPCWPRAKAFFEIPSTKSARVTVEGGSDVLVDTRCVSRSFASAPLWGCCRPDNSCGYDTHDARSAFKSLARADIAGFTSPECLSADALNSELRANNLAAWAYVPTASGRCDYAALDATLPR